MSSFQSHIGDQKTKNKIALDNRKLTNKNLCLGISTIKQFFFKSNLTLQQAVWKTTVDYLDKDIFIQI